MKKLLVPVDFSSHTEISCLYAVEIARATGAEIILFHSFFEQIYFSDGGFATGFESGIMLTDDIIRDFYIKKEKKLEEIAEELKNKARRKNGEKITVSCIIESGDPQIQILNAIGKIEPDLVVMGSAGLGKKGFLLGSVCKRIMDNTEVPVMALPDFREFKGLDNVLYVTEIEGNDVETISNLLNLLKDFPVHIHCLHLNVGNKDREADILMEALSTHPGIKEYVDVIDFRVLSCEDPKASLMEYIRQNNIQLIAFIPHKKNFFKIFTKQDLTKEDLFLTGLPILGIQ